MVGTQISVDLVGLPGLLAELRTRHPRVTVRLRTAMEGSAGLAQQLREGRLDVAILSLPGPPPPDLDPRLLASAPMLVYVPRSHPLAGQGRASLAQLAEFPFIDSPPGFTNRTIADQAFAAARAQREVTLEVPDVGTIADYIRAGLGIGFLGERLVPDLTGLDTLQVTDQELRWQLAVATASARQPGAATTALLDLLAERHPSPS